MPIAFIPLILEFTPFRRQHFNHLAVLRCIERHDPPSRAKTEYACYDTPQPDCRRLAIRNCTGGRSAATHREATQEGESGDSWLERSYFGNPGCAEGAAGCEVASHLGRQREVIECRRRTRGRCRRTPVWIAPGTSK